MKMCYTIWNSNSIPHHKNITTIPIKTRHIIASVITLRRADIFNSQYFNNYLVLAYVCTTDITLTEIIILIVKV